MVDSLTYFYSPTLENSYKKIALPLLLQYNFLIFPRDRWSEDLARHPHLSSPDHSEEEVENESDKEEHVYQSLDRQENWPLTEPVYSLPIKLPKVRIYKKVFLLRIII